MGEEATPYCNPKCELTGGANPPSFLTLNRKNMQQNLQELRVHRGLISKQKNLTAYTATGIEFFISGEMLKTSFKVKEDLSDLSYPFFAIVDTKEYSELDKDRNPIKDSEGNEKKFLRKTATSVFQSKDDLLQAVIDDDVQSDIQIEKEAHFNQKRKSANLSTSKVANFESAI